MACDLNYFFANAKSSVQIQSKSIEQDPDGFQTNDWQTLYSGRAVVKPLSGNETFSNGQLQSRASHKVLIRYQEALADTKAGGACKVILGSRMMNVLYVNNLDITRNIEGKFYQMLFCEENATEVE